MSERLVSVIIPARNESRLICQTLDCVLNAARRLHHMTTEIIVVDNASTDGTWDLLQKYVDHGQVIALRLDRLGAARANLFRHRPRRFV